MPRAACSPWLGTGKRNTTNSNDPDGELAVSQTCKHLCPCFRFLFTIQRESLAQFYRVERDGEGGTVAWPRFTAGFRPRLF